MSSPLLRLKPGLIFRAIDEQEAALLDIKGRSFFALNATGLFIVEKLHAGSTAAGVARAVAERFGTTTRGCRPDVDRFIEELRAAGMLETAPRPR